MAGDHQRNVGPMHSAPRCGARTRSGTCCASPCVTGSARCRMHGGKRSGAPKANRNALKDGLYAAPMLAHSARVRRVLREARSRLNDAKRRPT